MSLSGILNTARTMKQGSSMHISKDAPEYLEAISYIGVCQNDMERSGLAEGDEVNIVSAHGRVTLKVKVMDLQEGSFFMPLSFLANRLVSADTQGTGVPGFKDTRVTIEKA